MNYIRITKENIDTEHICCAMSGKQSIAKKTWMKQRFDEGLVFYRSEGRKREFLADPKFLAHKGFRISDISDCGINLMYLPLAENAEKPKFKVCARHPKVEGTGFVLYYTDQCPYTYYWVPRVGAEAKEHHIPLKTIHITTKEAAQNVPAPVTTYALFWDGQFVTQGIQSDKKFLALWTARTGIADFLLSSEY